MNKSNLSFVSIDSYIKAQPKAVQPLLKTMRQTIQSAAPQATEAIKYGMPTFVYHGNLVHFAAMKNHLGFYPAPSAISFFAQELSKYKTSKGAIQLPLDQALPLPLIKKITKFRMKENEAKIKNK